MQSDVLLLVDAFENFRNMCIDVYELDPAHFLSAPGLAWLNMAHGLMKDELKEDEDEGRMIMTEFVAVRPKAYAYLMDDDSEVKKAKGTKKCVIKRVLKFSKYKNCLLNKEIVLKRQAKDMRYILKKSIRLH